MYIHHICCALTMNFGTADSHEKDPCHLIKWMSWESNPCEQAPQANALMGSLIATNLFRAG